MTRAGAPSDVASLAALSFFPDMGHIVSVLRIARVAQEAGLRVRCFVPDEARPVVERFGLQAHFIGRLRPDNAGRVTRELAANRHSPLFAASAARFQHDYFLPVRLWIGEHFDQLRAAVADFGPTVVLADVHGCPEAYRAIAASLEAPLLSHVSRGSQYHCQPLDLRRHGVNGAVWGRSARIDALVRRAYAAWRRIARADARERERALERRADGLMEALSVHGAPAETTIGTGLGYLEARHLAHRITPCDDVTFFGTVDPVSGAELSDGLAGWLDRSDRPVAMVSFGTMLPPGEALYHAVVEAALAHDLRVLLVARDAPPSSPTATPEAVRRERFLPQPDVLADPRIRLFVTHGGGGGIQDALWSATPMIFVPFLWDQRYNASVVDALGAGICLGSRRVTPRQVEAAVRRIMRDDEIGSRAAQLSAEMRAADGAGRVVELIRSLHADAS